MSAAISVQHLNRQFELVHAVQDVCFEIPAGAVCGFVGANGAGKTTTMRILATLDYPSSGKAAICGHDVVQYPEQARRLIGWMPDHFGHYDHMTVIEYLDFYARAMGYRGKERIARIDEVIHFTELTALLPRFSNQLSKGNTQRLGLARALLHDPQVLIMDEPAAGLDPKARLELKQLIRLLARDGKTIFISSHILSELGEMCDSLLFIHRGRIVHHGDAETLKQATDQRGGLLYAVQIEGDPRLLERWCLQQPDVQCVELRRNGACIHIDQDDLLAAHATLRRLIKDDICVVDFHREQRNLENAFIDMLGMLQAPETPLSSSNHEPS